jgi:hypothetical protein
MGQKHLLTELIAYKHPEINNMARQLSFTFVDFLLVVVSEYAGQFAPSVSSILKGLR